MTDLSDPTVAAVAAYLHDGHAAMRELVQGLPSGALDWRPGPETNSIAALLTHALDAERHLTAHVAGVTLVRDREAAFRVAGLGGPDLVELVDRTERDVDAHLSQITPERLAARIERPGRTATGTGWLVHIAAHTREHVGQAYLTRQLAEQARVSSAIAR